MMERSKIFYLVLMPLLAALTFAIEQAMVSLPNIQLTVFLLLLYVKKLGLKRGLIITLLYVILDNLFSGYFNFTFFIVMLVGWTLLNFLTYLLGRKTENPFLLSLIGIFGSLVYSWGFVMHAVLVFHMQFKDYLIADLPFEFNLCLSSFLSILLLYKPLSLLFDKVILKKNKDNFDI